jgi:hypothetical protein
MPVEHHNTVRAGTTAKLLLIFVDGGGGLGKTGLTHRSPGASAAYIREGEAAVRRVPLSPGRLGEWAPGGLVEVDAELMPGVYQVGVPDEMLAPGSTRAMLQLLFDGARVRPIEVSLVAYDPQDAERIGVWSLANDKRHEFLRRALPRFTEMELALGAQVEGELREKLTERRET